MGNKKRVIIIGGGFGGLNVAKTLKKAEAEILLVDKTNHHVFQPLLYQVASAALSPGNIAVPLREIVKYQSNTTVLMANIKTILPEKQIVVSTSNEIFPYDYLVVATGCTHSYFGNEHWEGFAPGLKTIQDALSIREKILLAFEMAESSDDPFKVIKFLRFVIIGGGPTGVEMAGAIAEIARKTLFNNFRKIRPELSEIYLIEGLPQILPSYPADLARKAERQLEEMGVRVITNSRVTNIDSHGVHLGDRLIETSNIIWAAGNEAGELVKTLEVPLDRQGRVIVNPDLTIPDYSNVFVIGDVAHFEDKKGVLPGVAQVAIQQGKYVGRMIKNDIPQQDRKPFKYFDKGMMATIGKSKAIAVVNNIHISGFTAWLAWGFIHIAYLVSFNNRLLVMIQWLYFYITGKRSARLITRPVLEENDLDEWKKATLESFYDEDISTIERDGDTKSHDHN